MPADGTLAACSHARTSARPASKAVLKSSRFRGREEYGSASQLGQNPVVLWSSTGFPLRPQNPASAMPTDAALKNPAQRRAPPGWKFAHQSSPGRPRSRLLLIARAVQKWICSRQTSAATNRKTENITSFPRVCCSYRFFARILRDQGVGPVHGGYPVGLLPHVIEAVLNHVSGHKAGVAGIYNRAIYEREVRNALALWSDHVRTLVERGESKKILSFKPLPA